MLNKKKASLHCFFYCPKPRRQLDPWPEGKPTKREPFTRALGKNQSKTGPKSAQSWLGQVLPARFAPQAGGGLLVISRARLRVVRCALDTCQWHMPGLCCPKAVAYLSNSVTFPCVPFTCVEPSRRVASLRRLAQPSRVEPLADSLLSSAEWG